MNSKAAVIRDLERALNQLAKVKPKDQASAAELAKAKAEIRLALTLVKAEPDAAPSPAPAPDPTPTPPPPSRWPASTWRPFSDQAPVNTPVGPSPTLHPNSAAFIAHLMSVSSGAPADIEVRDNGFGGEPVYYVGPGDPLRTIWITDDEKWGGLPDLNGTQVRIPDGAVPEGGKGWDKVHDWDAHMTIVDLARGETVSLWHFQHDVVAPGQVVVKAQWGERVPLSGDGMALNNENATAAECANILGRVRIEELLAGQINHALAVTLPSTSITKQYIGKRLWLKMSAAEIAALPVPAWKKTIYMALATHGAFFVDYGGSSLMTFQYESGSQYTVYGQPDPWLAWASKAAGFTHWGGDSQYSPVWLSSFAKDGVDLASKLKLLA